MNKRVLSIFLLSLLLVFVFPLSVFADSNSSSGSHKFGEPSSLSDLTNESYYTVNTSNASADNINSLVNTLDLNTNFYTGLISGGLSLGVGTGTVSLGNPQGVNAGYRNQLASNNSQSFNRLFLYNNQTTDNSTMNYSPMFVRDSGNNTSYNWYNPVTNNYEVHNNWSYSPTFNTFHYTTNNYNTYITNNNTYISYYIMPTEDNADDAESYYFEIYFQLPDGRDSYDLTADDVKGTYFCYNAVNYDYVAEDDGTTLGLWHLNNDLKDSSYWANSTGKAYSSTYKDGGLSTGKFLATSTSDYFTLPLDKASFSPSSPYTLEWLEYTPSYDTGWVTTYSEEPHYNSSSEIGVTYTKREKTISRATSGIGNASVAWNSRYDDFAHYALVYDGTSYSVYINGVKESIFNSSPAYTGVSIANSELKFYIASIDEVSQYTDTSQTWTYKYSYQTKYTYDGPYVTVNKEKDLVLHNHITDTQHCIFNRNSIIDEVRLSKGVIYNSDFEPPSQEFTTNMVYVLPETANEGDFAIQSQYAVNGFRVGGVKPTYPSNGYVYVYEELGKVKSVQQYKGSGWYEVQASVYNDGAWEKADNFDLSSFTLTSDDDKPVITLEITKQPVNKRAHSGDNVTLSCVATGESVTYKWQKSSSGEIWEDFGESSAVTFTVSSDDDFDYENGRFRCVVSDSSGYVLMSKAVSVTIVPDEEIITELEITKQPENKKVHSGDDVTLSCEATGQDVAYKWQKSVNGVTWEDCGDTPDITFTVSSDDDFNYENGLFRCVVSDSLGCSIESDSVSITIVPDDVVTGDDDKKPDSSGIDDSNFEGIFGGIKKIIKAITNILSLVIEGISSLFTMIFDFIEMISGITGEFGDFLSSLFSFIPKEIFTVITLGINIIVVASVVKFIRG